MSLKTRLKRFEKPSAIADCPGCAVQQIGIHHKYKLPDGETITLPPIPERPPVTNQRQTRVEKPHAALDVAAVYRNPISAS